jgi:hypothetical protein
MNRGIFSKIVESFTRSGKRPDVQKLKSKGHIRGLVKALDGDLDIRDQAVEALVHLGEPTVERLAARLNRDLPPEFGSRPGWENELYARAAAATALGRIGNAKAADALVTALAKGEHLVRIAAARALGQIGDQRAVPPLEELLKPGSPHAQCAAALALFQLLGPRAAGSLSTALSNSLPEIAQYRSLRSIDKDRISLVKLLALHGGREAVRPLVELVRLASFPYKAYEDLDQAAISALEAITDRLGIEVLEAELGKGRDGLSLLLEALNEWLSLNYSNAMPCLLDLTLHFATHKLSLSPPSSSEAATAVAKILEASEKLARYIIDYELPGCFSRHLTALPDVFLDTLVAALEAQERPSGTALSTVKVVGGAKSEGFFADLRRKWIERGKSKSPQSWDMLKQTALSLPLASPDGANDYLSRTHEASGQGKYAGLRKYNMFGSGPLWADYAVLFCNPDDLIYEIHDLVSRSQDFGKFVSEGRVKLQPTPHWQGVYSFSTKWEGEPYTEFHKILIFHTAATEWIFDWPKV